MAKLTKPERAAHARATELVNLDRPLMLEEKIEVIQKWHEGAAHNNAAASAHFTPYELAFHVALEGRGRRVLDLCAGIGSLSVAQEDHNGPMIEELVLVEINPDYAAVAKRLLPQAEVIVGSVYDEGLIAELATRDFHCVISNPPFGNTAKRPDLKGPRYKGRMDYEVIDIASDLASMGVFILPQMALPFSFSGRQSFITRENEAYEKFSKATDIKLEMNCGIDTSIIGKFRDVSIITEIAIADFRKTRAKRHEAIVQPDLFGLDIAA